MSRRIVDYIAGHRARARDKHCFTTKTDCNDVSRKTIALRVGGEKKNVKIKKKEKQPYSERISGVRLKYKRVVAVGPGTLVQQWIARPVPGWIYRPLVLAGTSPAHSFVRGVRRYFLHRTRRKRARARARAHTHDAHGLARGFTSTPRGVSK